MTKEHKGGWREEFESIWRRQFVSHVQDPSEIVAFIETLLREQLERIKEPLKYDLIPVQVKEENESYWLGCNEAVVRFNEIINREKENI
jgi:predicted RNA-binding protein